MTRRPSIATSPWRSASGIVGRAIRQGRTQLVRDVTQDADYIAVVPEIQAQLSVPIGREGRVLGAISLETADPATLTPDIVDFVEHLAAHAALAIDNAARYEREREQNRALTRRSRELAAILQCGQHPARRPAVAGGVAAGGGRRDRQPGLSRRHPQPD